MDVRAKIIDQVLESLPDLSADIRDRIEMTLLTSLQGYEVQELEKRVDALEGRADITEAALQEMIINEMGGEA